MTTRAMLASLTMVATLSAAPARAEITTNEIIEIDPTFFVPCANGGAGELVQVTGQLHILTTRTVTPDHFYATSHFNPVGVTGIGLTTGVTYRGVGVTQAAGGGSLINGQFELSTENEFGLISQGSAPNLFLHFTTHLTFNSNGELASNTGSFKLVCQ